MIASIHSGRVLNGGKGLCGLFSCSKPLFLFLEKFIYRYIQYERIGSTPRECEALWGDRFLMVVKNWLELRPVLVPSDLRATMIHDDDYFRRIYGPYRVVAINLNVNNSVNNRSLNLKFSEEREQNSCFWHPQTITDDLICVNFFLFVCIFQFSVGLEAGSNQKCFDSSRNFGCTASQCQAGQWINEKKMF